MTNPILAVAALETSQVVSSKRAVTASLGVVTYKVCICCGFPKKDSEFYPRRLKCKACVQSINRKWEIANPEKKKQMDRRFYANNSEKQKQRSRLYRKRNPNQLKNWKLAHPNASQDWNVENRQRRREITNRGQKKLMSTVGGRLNKRMGVMIWESLRASKSGKTWGALVPYTVSCLKRHLEKQFKPGMSWEKLMEGKIHIDHVIPRSKFKFSKPDDIAFKQCWALENLQPLWAFDNLSKNNRIQGTPQIPLGI